MTNVTTFVGAAAALAGLAAAPAAAQYNPYPNQPGYNYPAYPGQAYPGYQQPYAQNPVGQIIDQLLGNRYNVTDRQAVSRCASAVMAQAQNQYRGYGYNGYPQNGYNQGIAAPSMRVTAITSVERRSNGLRVRGLLSSGYGGYHGGYGQNAYAYQNQGYGDLSFRCNVDYRGAVTGIRISRNQNRRY